MGEVIDLVPYLERRRSATVALDPPGSTGTDAEVLRDLLEEIEASRDEGICDICRRRRAVAEVHRSDAIEAGLGGMLQCRRCLISELCHNRSGPEARRAARAVCALLRDADRVVRIDVDWDTDLERALGVEGIHLG